MVKKSKKREALKKPLARNFYNFKGWFKNIMDHYSNAKRRKKMSPPDVLRKPVELFVKSVENVIYLNGQFSQDTYNLLYQTVNPLFDNDKYKTEVYEEIYKLGEEYGDNRFIIVAESLYYIRRVYEQNPKFIKKEFAKELKAMPGGDTQVNLQNLSRDLHVIFNAHVRQVLKIMIEHEKPKIGCI